MDKIKNILASAGPKEVILAVLVLVVGVPLILSVVGLAFFGTPMMGGTTGVTTMIAPTVMQGGSYAYDRAKGLGVSDNAAYYGESVSGSAIVPMPPIIGNPPASTEVLPAEKKVIQNGSLDLLVTKAEDTIVAITQIAETEKGFVENSNIYEISEGVKAGSIVIRVPADSFFRAIQEIKNLAVKVKRENTTTEDVTAQYVDLEAQLKNYRAEEAQYQAIMEKTVKIQDVLDVASRLAEVRGRIERIQGQMNYLSRQVGMSTISVSLTSEAEVEVFGIIWRPLTVLKQALKNLLADLAGFVDFLIYFLFKLPLLILELGFAAFIIWILWKIGRRIIRRMYPGNTQ